MKFLLLCQIQPAAFADVPESAMQQMHQAMEVYHQQLIAAGQHATAGAMLQKLLADEQTRPEAHYLLSISAQMRKQTEAALEHAQKAVQLRGNDARYQFTLGRAHKAANDIDAAEAAYRAALALQPQLLQLQLPRRWPGSRRGSESLARR